MPFCPKCRYEYKQMVEICPDCNEKLVYSLPEEVSEQTSSDIETYRDWVQIARLTSPQYAEMVVEALRTKNIPAVILSGTGHFGQTGQFGVSSFRSVGGGYSLMVPKEHVTETDNVGELILGDEWKKGACHRN